MKNPLFAALIVALASLPAHANTERKRNAEKPDYDAVKRELAFEMALIPEGTMEVGQPVSVILKMVDTKSGLAVPASFLGQTNGHIMHLTLADGTLTDVQHIHPAPTDVDGIYRFNFTPSKPGGYRGWAHVVSVEGKQQFVMSDLGILRGGNIDKTQRLQTEQNGYTFSLNFEDPPAYNKRRDATLSIRDKNGNAVTPDRIYIAGIHEDMRTILKTTFKKDSLLDFEIRPEEPGFVRLAIYITIGKRPSFVVPLGFMVTGEKNKETRFENLF